MALGHASMTIGDALDNLLFDVQATTPEPREETLKFMNLYQEGKGGLELKDTIVKCKFAYLEVLRFKINIQKATRLPKVDTFGTCDGFIEARIVRGSVQEGTFEHSPNEKTCVWSGKTEVVANDMDPKWNQQFAPQVPGHGNLTLQLILWDSNAPMPDVPICHCWVDLVEVAKGKPGMKAAEHKFRFSRLPGIEPVADFKKTTLKINLTYEQVLEK